MAKQAKKTAKKSTKKASKKAARTATKKSSSRMMGMGGGRAGKKTAKKKAKKKARRTVLYSSKGTKLYAKRDRTGKFKDIQTYARAHAADIRRQSADEGASASVM